VEKRKWWKKESGGKKKVVLYTVAVGVANWVSYAQFDTKRVSISSTFVGRYRGTDTKYYPPLIDVLIL